MIMAAKPKSFEHLGYMFKEGDTVSTPFGIGTVTEITVMKGMQAYSIRYPHGERVSTQREVRHVTNDEIIKSIYPAFCLDTPEG